GWAGSGQRTNADPQPGTWARQRCHRASVKVKSHDTDTDMTRGVGAGGSVSPKEAKASGARLGAAARASESSLASKLWAAATGATPRTPPMGPMAAPGGNTSARSKNRGSPALTGATGSSLSPAGRGRALVPRSPTIEVRLLGKSEQAKLEWNGAKTDLFNLGDIYLNDLSDLRVFELVNLTSKSLAVQLKAELRKPFHTSICGFQLENENVALLEHQYVEPEVYDEFNHLPLSVVRSSSKAALRSENAYLMEGYNELFNHIGTVSEIPLEPHETKRFVFSLCAKLDRMRGSSTLASAAYSTNADSSEEERMHLNETSRLMVTGRMVFRPIERITAATSPVSTSSLPEFVVPLQGQVCRSLLRLDVKELHFDDCVPGGSFVKDFTVWNRSEIPLLFKMVSSLANFDDTKDLITLTDYNSGYEVGDKTLQAAAFGHVRIRVTYRPVEIGERFFEIYVQNLHDCRNVKILKIHTVANKEHHREGLLIKEPNGSYLMSGSKLDFGDCYSGIASSKMFVIRNTTEASLHVELTSDRPKEVTFELKLQPNRMRSSRTSRTEEVLSPTDSNDGSSRKGSLSPDGSKALASFTNIDSINSYGLDSDEEPEDNEADYYDEEFMPAKRLSFEENQMGDIDDADDDFEFDREPRQPPRSPPLSPKSRTSRLTETRKRSFRVKAKRPAKMQSRVRDLAYESGVDSANSMCSSPERKRAEPRRRYPPSFDDTTGSNFLVETLDLAPGVERTILIWYCPASNASPDNAVLENSDAIDLKGCRLTKQTFRVSFRCFQIQGSWQQAQARVYDRTLGKSIHIRARTCTSIVTVTPSILHLGDCNIGELKSSSCMLTNHSELPTVVKPLVTSKVISTVPNDEMTLGPKQSTELKIEIIPRKINPNYSRMISIVNLKNKSNIPQVCVRSSNMDAHHVIYHSLFYKLLTQSKSAFLNFEYVAANSVGIQVFDLENITTAPLTLTLQSSDPAKVRLYAFKALPFGDAVKNGKSEDQQKNGEKSQLSVHSSLSSIAMGSSAAVAKTGALNAAIVNPTQVIHRHSGRVIRRRRSIGSVTELGTSTSANKRNMSTVLRGYLNKKLVANAPPPLAHGGSGLLNVQDPNKHRSEHSSAAGSPPVLHNASAETVTTPSTMVASVTSALQSRQSYEELASLVELFDTSRSECEQFCHSSVPSPEKEQDIVAMVRERIRRFQALLSDKKLVPLAQNKERNIRLPSKGHQRIVAVFSPSADPTSSENMKLKVEKHKIFITLPPGGNKKAIGDNSRFDHNRMAWSSSKHPFDSRPSVRELLLKSRVCRSVMNVNQKNINFGRITTSSKSSKKLVVQNMSAIPLVYSVEKTGSISSGFLEIKEGEMGVVKGFGTKEICFEFQPTLAGPFEEKLKIINVQDVDNSVSVTIKAKVVKRETFKLLQSGQVVSLGKCLVGEKSEEIKVAVRNTSRKRREYVIQVDPAFSVPNIRPTFYFSVDETPSCFITQAQEKKLDEELEKLEHKLRIATTKKKTDKIMKLNLKIKRVKALLSGEEVPDETSNGSDSQDSAAKLSESGLDSYDSCNSESEASESEYSSRSRRKHTAPKPVELKPSTPAGQSTNTLHFSLDAEATGRIVAYAVFHSIRSSSSKESDGIGKNANPRSHKSKKRQLRKDSAPAMGVGKFLLYEQQNKDIMKELQYNAEVFYRTAAGESAYCRAVGKSLLPPFAHGAPLRKQVAREASDRVSEEGKPDMPPRVPIAAEKGASQPDRVRESIIPVPRQPEPSSAADEWHPTVEAIGYSNSRPSSLIVPIEEAPVDSQGWKIFFDKGVLRPSSVTIDVKWMPTDVALNLLAFSCVQQNREDASSKKAQESEVTALSNLPSQIAIQPSQSVELHLRWGFASGAGFAPSTSLAACLSGSILAAISKESELCVGKLEFTLGTRSGSTARQSVDVVLVKSIHRSLYLDVEKLDLGQQQQNTDVSSSFVLRNRSNQPIKYLVLSSSARDSNASASTGTGGPGGTSGGEIMLENPTGLVEAGAHVVVGFTYRGTVPGQHTEQIMICNLNDRLDSSTLVLSARVTRPVYVRIPELDPHATGKLDVLQLGPCYVTPEMQDTSVDSPNVSMKFSKVQKLTLHSQVEETLVLCASSNLKTQCYVYDDAKLHREATHVILRGKSKIDLFVAFRPRLPADAFKTGASRDLVGGIRVQLFRCPDSVGSQPEDEKSEMVAEFTVKFVGVAGASLGRVTPSSIDFGVEQLASRSQKSKTHEGRFELVNLSKALPLKYRLHVTSDTDGYADDDKSLRVALKREKGEIPPGESGDIEFRLIAYSNGLFRRRILIENVHYPGKISHVDVVLFVDNGTLNYEVTTKSLNPTDPKTKPGKGTTQPSVIELGMVNVIKMEDEFLDSSSLALASDAEPLLKRYRVFEDRNEGLWFGAYGGAETSESTTRSIVLTNRTSRALVLRPVSTLPLTFGWMGDKSTGQRSHELELTSSGAPATEARKLHPNALEPTSYKPGVWLGPTWTLPAKGKCFLHFRFASIAMTGLIPADQVDNGKLVPFKGLMVVQSFDVGNEQGAEAARTLKITHLSGYYGEARMVVLEKQISLGKIGYSIGWKSSKFELSVKNVSDLAVTFTLSGLSNCIRVCEVRGATRVDFIRSSDSDDNDSIPSLRSLAVQTDLSNKTATSSTGMWRLQPMNSCVIEMELVHTEEAMNSGTYSFPLRVLNMNNPRNVEDVNVSVQVISSYAELVLDPDSSGMGAVDARTSQHVAYLPPTTVPPPLDASLHACGFWFSLKNVYDEDVCVKLSARTSPLLDRILELSLHSRSSNASIANIQIAPGDSVDVRVVCHVFPSARLPTEMLQALSNASDPMDIIDFGEVSLYINVQNMKEAAQKKEIAIRGRLIPGRTFNVSVSTLHFYGVAAEIPADLSPELYPTLKTKFGSRDSGTGMYQLRNLQETFWLRNPCTSQAVNFVIEPVAMFQPGLCLIKGVSASEICAMSEYIQAVAVPSSGTISPGEAVKVTVRLEEATAVAAGADSLEEDRASLHKMRHHPSWRSNSWGAELPPGETVTSSPTHMYLTVRDVDAGLDAGTAAEIDVHLVLQNQLNAMSTEAAKPSYDKDMLGAAFAAREKRLKTSKKPLPMSLSSLGVLNEETHSDSFSEIATHDNFEELDIGSIRSGTISRKNQLAVLAVRGCTPVENSSLENTRYVIDVGQHTVRNGGEVEWEITVEAVYAAVSDNNTPDPVDYKLLLVDKTAASWVQLSRDRGTLDRSRSYQSVVLYFIRQVVGVYSTFLVLQNLANPSDLKVIHVRLEVIADLNSLRSMSAGMDPATNLFRVLVSSHNNNKRHRRQSIEAAQSIPSGSQPQTAPSSGNLVIDYGDVYYHKLYHNHSIVLENSSGLTLDFMLSSNARPQEVSFSVSPTSFNEVSSVTLGAHARMQVFVHFRPLPRSSSTERSNNDSWQREVEVYINCRLVKDFRETVVLKAVCNPPQLLVNVAASRTDDAAIRTDSPALFLSTQPTFLGIVFCMPEANLANSDAQPPNPVDAERFLIVRNSRTDGKAKVALRNDSMFFNVAIDQTMTPPESVVTDYLDSDVCGGRRATLVATIQPLSYVVLRVTPDLAALWKHHQLWDHSVKEHITLYNIRQFAEHYQVTVCFTRSNIASFYVPPSVAESYPLSALEDTIAKFLQNYNQTWKWLLTYQDSTIEGDGRSSTTGFSASKLAGLLSELESALDLSSPLSPRKATTVVQDFLAEGDTNIPALFASKESLHQFLQAYRALYFDFYYITDELVWYGVRGNAPRHSLMLADLAYGVVFGHDIFRCFLLSGNSSGNSGDALDSEVEFPRLLLQWIRQLGHFLSFFPENQEATLPLRQLYDKLRKIELRTTKMAKHQSSEKRRRSDSASESDSDSDSSHKRHRERKHKHKHRKREDKERKHKRKRDRHERDDGAATPDFERALATVEEMLTAFPALLSDLLGLLQTLDDGQMVVISGIANRDIRSRLKTLFPLLGLSKVDSHKGAYKKRGAMKRVSLLETMHGLLARGSTAKDKEPSKTKEESEADASGNKSPVPLLANASEEAPAKRAIGPSLPPSAMSASSTAPGGDDSDDDVIGPALPGMKGFRRADERVEAEMARQALLLEQGQTEETKSSTGGREEWMTMMPSDSALRDAMAGAPPRPTGGKQASFRSREPAAVDHTWFDSPEERDRAKRAELDLELLGYVREENKPLKPSTAKAMPRGKDVDSSICPAAAPESDANTRRQMQSLKDQRGPSLMEQFLANKKKEADKGQGSSSGETSVWNRDRDLASRRGMSTQKATELIQASKQINSRFTAPTVTRQFL
ncbi:TPA: hypothetical protein N0F65_005898, partial [Lagenidium giganteum]